MGVGLGGAPRQRSARASPSSSSIPSTPRARRPARASTPRRAPRPTIQSKHAIQIFDHGVTDDGRPYMVMELLIGRAARRAHRARSGACRSQRRRASSAQVCRALQRAHDAGIIHRDLKPENIFLVRSPDDDDEIAKVLDFGIAKIKAPPGEQGLSSSTKTGAVLGHAVLHVARAGARAAHHRPPGRPLVARRHRLQVRDGRPAVRGRERRRPAREDLHRARAHPVADACPGLPPAFDAWFARTLEREPARRFASASELADALALCGGPQRAKAAPMSSQHAAPAATPVSRHARLALAAAAAGLTSAPFVTSTQPPRSSRGVLVAVAAAALVGAIGVVASSGWLAWSHPRTTARPRARSRQCGRTAADPGGGTRRSHRHPGGPDADQRRAHRARRAASPRRRQPRPARPRSARAARTTRYADPRPTATASRTAPRPTPTAAVTATPATSPRATPNSRRRTAPIRILIARACAPFPCSWSSPPRPPRGSWRHERARPGQRRRARRSARALQGGRRAPARRQVRRRARQVPARPAGLQRADEPAPHRRVRRGARPARRVGGVVPRPSCARRCRPARPRRSRPPSIRRAPSSRRSSRACRSSSCRSRRRTCRSPSSRSTARACPPRCSASPSRSIRAPTRSSSSRQRLRRAPSRPSRSRSARRRRCSRPPRNPRRRRTPRRRAPPRRPPPPPYVAERAGRGRAPGGNAATPSPHRSGPCAGTGRARVSPWRHRRDSTSGSMLPDGQVQGPGGSTLNLSSVSSGGLAYALDGGLRFARTGTWASRWSTRASAPARTPPRSPPGAGSLSSSTTAAGIVIGFIANPDRVSFFGELGAQARWYDSVATRTPPASTRPRTPPARPSSASGVLDPGRHSFRLLPEATAGLGAFGPPSYSGVAPSSATRPRTARAHGFVMLGLAGFYNVDL